MATVEVLRTKFTDIDISFIRHPVTNDIPKVKDHIAIGRAIKSLVMMRAFDDPFHPEASCQINDLLFEQMTHSTISTMKRTIYYALENFEPRAEIIDIVVEPDFNKKVITITIIFKIVGLADTYQVKFNLDRTI